MFCHKQTVYLFDKCLHVCFLLVLKLSIFDLFCDLLIALWVELNVLMAGSAGPFFVNLLVLQLTFKYIYAGCKNR